MMVTKITPNLHIPAGRLFCFSEGEYSDYGYTAHFVALVDITPETFDHVIESVKSRIRSGEIETPAYRNLGDDFVFEMLVYDSFKGEFIRAGVALEVDCHEIHLGNDRLEITGRWGQE